VGSTLALAQPLIINDLCNWQVLFLVRPPTTHNSVTFQVVMINLRESPRNGIVEDVLIKMDKYYFPMDFIVLDIEPVEIISSEISVILG
jgi:hypothetical protein